jgi:hypothetical protein
MFSSNPLKQFGLDVVCICGEPAVNFEVHPAAIVKLDAFIDEELALVSSTSLLAHADLALRIDDALPGDVVALDPSHGIAHFTGGAPGEVGDLPVTRHPSGRDLAHDGVDVGEQVNISFD